MKRVMTSWRNVVLPKDNVVQVRLGLLLVGLSMSALLSSFVMCLVADHMHLGLLSGPRHAVAQRGTSRNLLDSQSQTAGNLRSVNGKIPRYNFQFQPVSSQFNPTSMDYLQSIGFMAAIIAVIAVLLLLFGIVFCVCRKCCNCCGGKVASEGCCCMKRDYDGEPIHRTYTTCERTWVRLGMIFVVASMAGIAVMGWVGNSEFSTAFGNIFDTVISALQSTLTQIQNLENSFTNLINLTSLLSVSTGINKSSFDSLNSAVNSIISTVQGMKTSALSYDSYRSIAINALLAFCVFVALFGALGALFGCGWPACILAVLGFLSAFLSWIAFAIHFPISVFLGDMCTTVDAYITERTACENNNNALAAQGKNTVDCTSPTYTPDGQYLNQIIQCVSPSTSQTITIDQWQNMAILLAFRAQSSADYNATAPATGAVGTIRWLWQTCANSSLGTNCSVHADHLGAFRLAPTAGSTQFTNASITQYGVALNFDSSNTTLYTTLFDESVRQQLLACVQTNFSIICNASSAHSSFDVATQAYKGFNDISNTILTLTGCSYLLNIAQQIFDSICVGALTAFSLITVSFAVISFLYLFALFFSILGLKRFSKQEADEGASVVHAQRLKPMPPVALKNMAQDPYR